METLRGNQTQIQENARIMATELESKINGLRDKTNADKKEMIPGILSWLFPV